MKCPICKNSFESIEYTIIGQAMCPVCGEIIDITDEPIDDEDENYKDEDYDY